MQAPEFCYWLQGFFEISRAGNPPGAPFLLNGEQVTVIQRHLALVFQHDIDPKQGPPAVQQQLQDIHDGRPPSFPLSGPIPGQIVRC